MTKTVKANKLTDFDLTLLACMAHEANKVYCELHGDTSQMPWEEAPDNIRASALAGVKGVKGVIAGNTPRQSHESWLKFKEDEGGWTYGPAKDLVNKTHPCLVAYDDLPPEQRMKDYIFVCVVRSAIISLFLDVVTVIR